MAIEQTAELAAENEVQTETVETTKDQTVEDAEGGDDAKQEGDSFYEEELKRLRDEAKAKDDKLAEKERQLEIKDRALQAEKKKARAVPPEKADMSLKDEIFAEWEARQAEREAKTQVKSLTQDKSEQELVMHHYQHSIVKTGDIEVDLQRALAVANAKRLPTLLNRATEMDAQEERAISSMSGSLRGENMSSKQSTALEREVSKLVSGILKKDPKDVSKIVKKYV